MGHAVLYPLTTNRGSWTQGRKMALVSGETKLTKIVILYKTVTRGELNCLLKVIGTGRH